MTRIDPASGAWQRGLTLVELMVALAISLTLVVAASTLFLNTRFAQRHTDERSVMQETGQLALDIIGSQIANAGFYPLTNSEQGSASGAYTGNLVPRYDLAIGQVAGGTAPAALAWGLHGCDGSKPKSDYSGCDADTTTGAAGRGGLTVSYFTTDAMSLEVGMRGDCSRANIANDSDYNNAGRVGTYAKTAENGQVSNVSRGASGGLPPAQALLGVNQFFLQPVTNMVDSRGATISTYALACRGNGGAGTVPLLQGVEQLTFRYGVISDSTAVPTQYMDAAGVNTLAGDLIVGDQTLSGWGRVAAVRVCVLVRSLNPGGARLNTGAITDCTGSTVTPPAGVGYQVFTQTFAVKNRLQQTVGL